jgi:hypothetical protein
VDRETLEELRNAQLSQLRTWLEGPSASEAWLDFCRACQSVLEGTALGELLSPPLVDALVEVALSEEVAEKTVRPVARRLIEETGKRTRAIDDRLDELVGEEARAAFEALAARTDLIDEELLRRVVADPGLEAVMRDVLYDALTAFNERTNPFVASWGVPALLDAIPMIGRGAVRKAFEGARTEFERRLEPEMRKFLAGFAKKSLQNTVDIATQKAAEEDMVAWRKRVVRIVLDQPTSQAIWATDDERGAALVRAVELALVHLLSHPRVRELFRTTAQELLADNRERSLIEVANAWGIAVPDLEPLMRAAWPAAQRALADDRVLAVLGRGIDAAHAAWLAAREST